MRSTSDAVEPGKALPLGGLPWQRSVTSISGTVTTLAGAGLPGAQVCVWQRARDAPTALTREPRCAQTGSDGYYRLDKLLPVELEVNAAARGFLPKVFQTDDSYRIRVPPGQQRTGVDFVLEPGGVEVSGIIKDLAGGVVEGAQVRLRSGSAMFWSARGGTAVVVTDAEGSFKGWVAKGRVRVSAQADGYGTSSRWGTAPGYSFELFLTPESVLSGRVVLAGTQTPVPNATVSATDSPWRNRGRAVTDADGRFQIDRLEPGQYHPTATADAGSGRTTAAVHVGLAQSADTVVIEIHPAASVAGVVVLAGTEGEPCTQGRVVLAGTDGNSERRSGNLEPDGAVTIYGVPAGSYDVSVFCKGNLSRTDFETLVVGEEPIGGQQWEVEPGAVARGIVLDAAGKPIEGADVRARAVLKGRAGAQSSSSAATTASGAFELKGLGSGAYKITASKAPYLDAPEPTLVEVGAAGVDSVEITLGDGGTIRGRVVDQHGVPVGGANVSVTGSTWRAQSSTDDEGNFELAGAKPGQHRVTANKGWRKSLRAPGASDDDVQGEPVTVVAGETSQVDLVVESQAGEISGQVVGAGGEPIFDAFISCRRESDSATAAKGGSGMRARWGTWGEQPVLTDQDGAFTVKQLSDGKYTIRAYRKGGGEAVTENIEVGSAGVTLEIQTNGSLSGTVVFAAGGSPDRFSVTASDKKSGINASDKFYKTDGHWSLAEVPAGEFEVTVTSDRGDATTSITLAAGEALEGLKLELTPRINVRGRVLDIDTQQPVGGLSVTIGPRTGSFTFSSGGKGDKENVTDDDGRFSVDNAAAGSVMVMVIPRSWDGDGYSWTRISLNIPADADTYTLPDIFVVKPRKKRADDKSDLGFKVKDTPPGSEANETPIEIAFVRPGGPASKAGLKVGDVIEKVDGHDVTGSDRYRYRSLVAVKVGTSIELSVGDDTVTLVAGAEP